MSVTLLTNKNINNLCSAIDLINILGILIEPKWVNRICKVQNNWDQNYHFVELNYSKKMDLYCLIDNVSFFINVQEHEGKQLNKSNLTTSLLPSLFCEFILTEPLISYGTTNLIWGSSGHPIRHWNKINLVEQRFLNTFIEEYSLISIIDIVKYFYDYKFSELQLKGLIELFKKKDISIIGIKKTLGISINKSQLKEIIEFNALVSV